MDSEPIQVRLWRLLADVGRGAHVNPHCDDVEHLPTHTGNLSPRTLIFCSQLP